MKKLLLGTGNPRKIEHYRKFLAGTPYQLLTLKDVGIAEEPEETGETLEENAVIKAKFYFSKSNLPTIADDAGFEIPALGNFPGTHSGRFADLGRRMTDREIIAGILEKMKGLKGEERKARMRVVQALMLDAKTIHTATGTIEGRVPEKPYEKRLENFPYRSLLFVTGLNKWFYDISREDEDALGYRKAATESLKKYL